jgi:hypothetical protein
MITNRFAPTLRVLFVGALLLLAPRYTSAQDVTLDRIHNLAAAGRLTEARNTLAGWERQHADPASAASAGDRARAMLLRGMLSEDAKDAEEAYLAVVLSHPSSAAAPDALLRLGQGLLAAGEPRRAVAYLERLRTDYPQSPARETGWLWLARAQLAVGATAAACDAARTGLAITRAENLRILLELERDNACGAAAGAAPQTDARATPPRTPPAAANNARFAVQIAAFRERAGAEATAAQLREQGFDARVVTTEGSVLYRVRFGFFTDNLDAANAARRVRNAGFNAMVVDDVSLERTL